MASVVSGGRDEECGGFCGGWECGKHSAKGNMISIGTVCLAVDGDSRQANITMRHHQHLPWSFLNVYSVSNSFPSPLLATGGFSNFIAQPTIHCSGYLSQL